MAHAFAHQLRYAVWIDGIGRQVGCQRALRRPMSCHHPIGTGEHNATNFMQRSCLVDIRGHVNVVTLSRGPGRTRARITGQMDHTIHTAKSRHPRFVPFGQVRNFNFRIAAVVKVERPDGGDDTRAWGPPWTDRGATYYLGLNRGKRSIALDLREEGDRELAWTLATHADVVLESFRSGTMERFGLGYDAVAEANPGVVYCSVTAFGADDPRPGYAPLAVELLAPYRRSAMSDVLGRDVLPRLVPRWRA